MLKTLSYVKKNNINKIVPLKSIETIGQAIFNILQDIHDEVVNFVEAGQDRFRCDLDTPIHVLTGLGYNSLTVWLTGRSTDLDCNNNQPTLNAFTILKTAARQYSSYPLSREEKTQKDVLFNKVVAMLKANNVGFTPIQVESTGKTVATTLTSILWFMDGRHHRFEGRGVTLPDMFQSLRGHKEQHQKVPEITCLDLKENVDKLGELLLLPWILNPKILKFKAAVNDLLCGLHS